MNYETFKNLEPALREPTHSERGNGKYGDGFGTCDRAAEIFEVEGFNLPDESYLFEVDLHNPQAVLREIQLAYAAGWAIGESISTTLILGWLRSRNSVETRATLLEMSLSASEFEKGDKLARNWHRFECAPELADTILGLSPVVEREDHGRDIEVYEVKPTKLATSGPSHN